MQKTKYPLVLPAEKRTIGKNYKTAISNLENIIPLDGMKQTVKFNVPAVMSLNTVNNISSVKT
jgi:hypothetical protein